MATPREWATDIEIFASAAMLGTDIMLWTRHGRDEARLTFPAALAGGHAASSDKNMHMMLRGHHFDLVANVVKEN